MFAITFQLSHTIQERSYTPLMVACTLGDGVHQVVELLLKSGANASGHSEVCLSTNGVATLIACKVIGGNSGRGVTPDTSTSIGYSFRCERPHCFEPAQLVLQGMHEKLKKSCSRTLAIQPRTADFPQLTGSNY